MYIWLAGLLQGTNARKFISEVYASFVLQCTVWHGIHISHKNQWDILVMGKYNVNFQNFQFYYPPRILNENWCILVYGQSTNFYFIFFLYFLKLYIHLCYPIFVFYFDIVNLLKHKQPNLNLNCIQKASNLIYFRSNSWIRFKLN